MDMHSLEQRYLAIVGLYDLADQLVATVEAPETANAEHQFALIEPLANDISDSADILTQEFTALLAAGAPESAARLVSQALNGLFTAVERYESRPVATGGQSTNAADTIAEAVECRAKEIRHFFDALPLNRVTRH